MYKITHSITLYSFHYYTNSNKLFISLISIFYSNIYKFIFIHSKFYNPILIIINSLHSHSKIYNSSSSNF